MDTFLSVRKSRNGSGIFTTKEFKQNRVIFKVTGVLYRYDVLDSIGGQIQDNSFRFDSKNYLSPQNQIGDFLNHSCNPNAFVKKTRHGLFVVALEKIAKGEEITIDYSTILGPDDSWSMKCNCGEENCRKVIKKFNSLDKALLLKYKSLKMIPQFLLKLS